MSIVTTLSFKGRTEEALDFYRQALNAQTTFLMRFRDSPDKSHHTADSEDLIFHATFCIEGTTFMASDVGYADSISSPSFDGFALLLRLSSKDRAQRIFDALAAEGRIIVPFAESAFTSWYGIVDDRFGVSWKLNVDSEAEGQC